MTEGETRVRTLRAPFFRPDHPFWVMVGVRSLFLVLTAFTLVWAPYARTSTGAFFNGATQNPQAYNGLTDLIFNTFGTWDSGHFLHIAQHGYDAPRYAAFYPLYPLLVAGAHYALGSYLVAGVLISLVSGGLAGWAVASIGRSVLSERATADSVLYLALYPTAFVFTAVYSDGLFLALAAGSFLAAMRRRPWLAALTGALAVATRATGFALLPALLYLLWPRKRGQWWHPVPSLLALPAALGAYSLYLHHRRGDWLAFSHAERFWTRSTPHLGPLTGLKEALAQGLNSTDLVLRHLPRRLGGQAGFNADFQHAMWDSFHLLLFVAACLLTVVAWRKLGIAFGLYSAATLLIVLSEPADGFALESFPRFVMADFPLVLALASLTASRPGARTWTLVGLASSCAVAGVAFSRGTVWVA